MSTFENALRRFDQLLDDTPDHVLRAHRTLIKNVCKKLNKSQGTAASSLFDALESSREIIEDYTKLPVERAVVCPVDWAGTDLRVHDIRLGATRHDLTTKFRKGLGERSLALEYHEWEMQEFQCSRLVELCKDPGNCKKVINGNITSFLTARNLPDLECVQKGIRHGTKLLLLENLVGTPGTSVLLFFAFGKFREVKYPNMSDLAESMRKHVWIPKLVRKLEPWFQNCWAVYDGL